MSDPNSPSTAQAQAAAAAYLRQLQLQGALSSGHSSSTTFDVLKHQEEQLLAARMLLQQQQSQRQHQPFRGFLGLPSAAAAARGGNVYPRESLLAAAAARQGEESAFSATVTTAAKAAKQAEQTEEEKDQKKKKEAESTDESNSEVDEEEQVSDDEYFQNFSPNKVSSTAAASKEDGSTEATAEEADGKIEIESFPHKVYRMLYEAEKEGNEHIVSFLPSGRGFAIHDAKKFADCIMGRYFTTRRLASFQRQLNLYGFRRISEGKEKGGYFHKDFIKGKRHLSKKIKRKSTASKTNLAGAPNTSFRRLSSTSSHGIAPETHFPSILSGRNSLTGSSNMFVLGQYPHPATTKELLLAALANSHDRNHHNNNNSGLMHNSASGLLGADTLLDMTRQGYMASQHRNGGASAVNHHEILRNAATSLALARQNQNDKPF